MIPIEINQKIAQQLPSKSLVPYAQCSFANSNRILEDELFWRLKCYRNGFTELIKSGSAPRSINNQRPWRGLFRENHVTDRNWKNCRYSNMSINAKGQVCLSLDGVLNKALSAVLPAVVNEGCLYWDLETGLDIKSFGKEQDITSVAKINQHNIYCGHRDGNLSTYDARSIARPVMVIEGAHVNEICALDIVGNNLLTGSADEMLKFWDLRKVTKKLKEKCCLSTVTCASIDKDGASFSFGCLNGKVFHNGKEYAFKNPVNCIKQYQKGNVLWVGLDDGKLISIASGKHPKIVYEQSSPIISMHLTENRAISGCSNGAIFYSNISNDGIGEPNIQMIKEPNRCRGIIWQIYADRSRIISSSLDKRLLIHDFGPTKYYP